MTLCPGSGWLQGQRGGQELGGMPRAATVLERMVNQNIYSELIMDFKVRSWGRHMKAASPHESRSVWEGRRACMRP